MGAEDRTLSLPGAMLLQASSTPLWRLLPTYRAVLHVVIAVVTTQYRAEWRVGEGATLQLGLAL